jgi:hypothetical protein
MDFNYLKNNLTWKQFKPYKNILRYGAIYQPGTDSEIDVCITKIHQKYNINKLFNVWFNYYETGEHYTPSHKHKESDVHIIASFGGTRKLKVGNVTHKAKDGDEHIIFGNELHGVPKQRGAEPRISMVLFYH